MRRLTPSSFARLIVATGGIVLIAPLQAQTPPGDADRRPTQERSGAAAASAPAASDPTGPAGPTRAGDAAASRDLATVKVVGSVDTVQSLDFYAPNSSAVISQQQIEAQGARKLDQALQYQAGVLSEPFGGDNKVEWFKIRGFDASTSLDGTPTTPNGYFVWKPEIFGVESIEVLKGPSALVFGASETGGVVNLITKRPQKKESLMFSAEVGNRGRKGFGLDYNGIANSEGNVYYRIVAQAREEDGLQRGTNMKSFYLAPSVTVDFTRRTSLTLLTSIQHEDGRPTNGFLPAYGTIIDTPYGKIDRRLNAGEPGFDRLRRTQTSAGLLFKHEIASGWTFTQNYRFSRLNINQQNVFAFGSDNDRQLLRGYTYTQGGTDSHYFDSRLSGRLKLGDAVELRPVIGFDYLKSNTSGQNNGFGMAPNLDMFAPVYGAPFAVTSTPYELNSNQLGLYASAQMQVAKHWNFNAGLRHDRARSGGVISGANSGYDASHNSVNVGAMYISDFGISPYISSSESFKPVAGVDGYGNAYKPYEGQQREVGLKLEPSWLNGGTVTLAYFDVKEKNALIADASNIQSQSGKRTNRGIELQGDFNLGPSTRLRAAYTHNNSRQDISASESVRTPLLPKHQASLWLSHHLQTAQIRGLTLAGGVRYNGSTEDQRYHPGEKVGSFVLFDLMTRYEINRELALQLNVRNLTDKTYVSGCDFYCYYGNGRTIDLQLKYAWR